MKSKLTNLLARQRRPTTTTTRSWSISLSQKYKTSKASKQTSKQTSKWKKEAFPSHQKQQQSILPDWLTDRCLQNKHKNQQTNQRREWERDQQRKKNASRKKNSKKSWTLFILRLVAGGLVCLSFSSSNRVWGCRQFCRYIYKYIYNFLGGGGLYALTSGNPIFFVFKIHFFHLFVDKIFFFSYFFDICCFVSFFYLF